MRAEQPAATAQCCCGTAATSCEGDRDRIPAGRGGDSLCIGPSEPGLTYSGWPHCTPTSVGEGCLLISVAAWRANRLSVAPCHTYTVSWRIHRSVRNLR